MQLISKYNKGIRYLLCAIDFFSKYAFLLHLKDKKRTAIVNAFQSILVFLIQKENQIKYRLIKVVSFTASPLKNG